MTIKLTNIPPRKQKAVWWPSDGQDDQGNVKYGQPYEIDCRWEDVHELFRNNLGNEVVSSAKVYPDRVTPEGGVLWLGKIDDLVSQTNPFAQPRAFIIQRFENLPDFPARKNLLVAML